MDSVTVGRLEIHRVVEDDRPIFSPWELFPDARPEDLADERGRTAPRFYDEGRELLETSMHSYVFRTGGRTVLIDACVGNDKPGRRREYWRGGRWPFLENLAAAGFAPDDVDLVLITHLHVDHVGWNTRLVDGCWEPTFPNARYLFSEPDLAALRAKHGAGDGQYVHVFEDSVKPVLDAGLAEPVGPDHDVGGGIRFEPAPGHTPGQVNVRISDDGAEALATGDVFHHPVQAAFPGWNSAACEHASGARETRRRLFEREAGRGTLILPAHFPPCRLRRAEAGFRFVFDRPGEEAP